MEAKNVVFQKLKPSCIALTQAALTYKSRQTNATEVTSCLVQVRTVLEQCATTPASLDHKLADYVFFPLSQVLGASQTLPVQALEVSFECLSILIAKGWRANISAGLSTQLLILLSLTADRSQKPSQRKEPSDDLCRATFSCFTSLFQALKPNAKASAVLTTEANVPSLGHAVSVILDGIASGTSYETQLAASEALHSLVNCLSDMEVLASFLPGVTSTLSKVLTPSTQVRRHWKVLVENISIMTALLRKTVSNVATEDLRQSQPATDASSKVGQKSRKLDKAWLQASAGQLKLALANIDRLHSHSRIEVKEALLELNIMILSECSQSLPTSRQLALETSLVLSEDEGMGNGKTRMLSLMRTDERIVDALQTTFRDWTVSLTRIMQSSDDDAKQRRLRQLFTAFNLLTESGIELQTSFRLLGTALHDGVTTLLRERSLSKKVSQRVEPVILQDLTLAQSSTKNLDFSNPLVEFRSQQEIFSVIVSGIFTTVTSKAFLPIATNLAAILQDSNSDSQVSAFWLLLRLLDSPAASPDELSAFLTIDDASDDRKLALREEVYSFALFIVEDDEQDVRTQALALEAIAMYAQRTGEEFRDELIDALYPVLHHLGSSVPQIRSHAITCLNIVADACGYSDVKELVVANVDYLVNAVALKLNAFDVSPQGPQVLLMMVRLAGPSVLPFLEDTVESIFAALEDYHGYPTLVELLFAVLKTVAEEGVKAPQLAITASTSEKKDTNTTTIDSLAQMLQDRKTKASIQPEIEPKESHPEKPWGDETKKRPSGIEELEDPEDSAPQAEESADPPPPAPKTYSLILKITQLTQHYLSSASPSLRTSLLSLISTTIPALAAHENSYLPLVNTLWPELVSRLRDEEPYIVSGSMDVIAIMCRHAGSFMRSRIESLWHDLEKVHSRLSRSFRETAPKTTGSDVARIDAGAVGYVDTSVKAMWNSFQNLLLVCVQHVGIDAAAFDTVLVMLRPVVGLDSGAKEILRTENADAVWLAEVKERRTALLTPEMEGISDWKFAVVGA